MKFNKYCKLTLVLLLLISIILFSFSHHISSFKSAYTRGSLYQQIIFACSENLFEQYTDLTVSKYKGIKSKDGNYVNCYNKKVTYNKHCYEISYINSNDKNLYAFIKSNFGNANLTIYFYHDYYSINMLYESDSYSFSTCFNVNLDFDTDNLSLEDEENYKKTLKIISESTIKETIEIFYREANNDMKIIYDKLS